MSGLQKEAIQMINALSDDNLNYLIDFIKRFMLPKNTAEERNSSADIKEQAFYEMEQNKKNLLSYFPSDFNPQEEYREAMKEKYGNTKDFSESTIKAITPEAFCEKYV